MAHAQLVNAITGGFLSPTLSKQLGKLSYSSICGTYFFLTANASLTKSPCGGDQNGHLVLVLTANQYALVCQVPFVQPTNPGRTPNIPAWTTPLTRRRYSMRKTNSVDNTTNFVTSTLHSAISYIWISATPTSRPSRTPSRDTLKQSRSNSLSTSMLTT